MSMEHASAGLVEPPSPHLRSEVAIVCGMAKATLPDCGIDWDWYAADYNRIRDKIEAVFPELFADFNQRIRQPGGFHLTIPPRERVWKTATGRANFIVFPGLSEDAEIAVPGMLRLATLRSHDQYNTTIYSLNDRYRGVFGGRMVVFMNEADMRARGIAEGDSCGNRVAGGRQTTNRRRLLGEDPCDRVGIGGRLLPGDQSATAARLSRCEKRYAGGEIDTGPGSPSGAQPNA